MIEMKIEGLEQLRNALLSLPDELHQKELKHATAAMARVVRDRAQNIVPALFDTGEYTETQKRAVLKRRRPGTLRENIRVGFSKLGSSKVQVTYNVYVKKVSKGKFKGKGRDNPDDPYYWAVWEFGNSINSSRPFLRPAFDQTRSAQLEQFYKRLSKGIERAAKRLRIR